MSKLDDIKIKVDAISPVWGDHYAKEITLTTESKKQIKALFLEVIGKDIKSSYETPETLLLNREAQNRLRAHLRQKVEEL